MADPLPFEQPAAAPAPTPRDYKNRSWDPDRKEWVNAPALRPYIEITPTEPKALPFEKKPDPLASAPTPVPEQPSFLHRLALGTAFPGALDKSPEELRERGLGGFLEDINIPGNIYGSVKSGVGKVWEGYTGDRSDPMNAPGPMGISPRSGQGALEVIGAPFTAVGKAVGGSVEKLTGGLLPSETTETALMLGKKLPQGPQLPTTSIKQTAQKILAPETLSPESRRAAGSIRSHQGLATRDYEQTSAAVEQFRGLVNTMDAVQRRAFMDYVETRSTQPMQLPPEMQQMADTLRQAFRLRRDKLERLYPTMDFVEDYFPHMWKDPRRARQFVRDWNAGVSRQGSGASVRARSLPTMEDGLRAGLEPVTTDPIEATLRYTQSMDRFIAQQEILQTALTTGDVRYVKPKTVGASGHPDPLVSTSIPEGWVPITGRGSERFDGAKAYAPADWARVYNNFFSPGWHQWETGGKILDKAQLASNSITALELGLSGYHALTMAKEGFISELGRGLSQLASPGQRIAGVGAILSSPAAPVKLALTGRKAREVYLGRTPGTADFRQTMDLLAEAGGRAVAGRHAPEYEFSSMDNYWTAWKRGALRQELAGDKYHPGRIIGRAMSTVAYPLFKQYIPLVKDGAFHETMSAWIKANPTASHEAQVAAARKIWDSMDNRFGEMVQDNIFWDKLLKQSAILATRSYSWNMGTVREIGGGLISTMKDPRKLSMTHPDYDPRTAYVVAFPVAVASLNAVYQYMKTGTIPDDLESWLQPQTGGTSPGFGGKGTVPEHASMPGYEKDVLGWLHDARQEAANKVARGPMMAWETVQNSDWRGDPIRNLEDPAVIQLGQYLKYVADSLTPISVKNIMQGRKTGSNLGVPSQLLGIRSGSPYIQDPEGYERGMSGVHRRAWQRKQRHDRNLKRQYERDDEAPFVPSTD